MKEPTLVIMAAGMGSRYGGLKQMDKITAAGEIILDFSLYDAYMAGFKKAVVIIKKEYEEDFKALLDGKAANFLDIQFAFQDIDDIPEGFEVPEGRVKPWGTGHAVLSARDLIDGPFAVINADDYYGPGAFQKCYDYLAGEGKDYLLVTYNVENTLTENGTVSRGVCAKNEEGYLTEINERTKIGWTEDGGIAYEEDEKMFAVPKGTPVSMNFWGFPESFMGELKAKFPEKLEQIMKENPIKGEYFLPFVVDELTHEGKAKVKVLNSEDKWYGVTYKEDKEYVKDALQSMKDRGIYPEILWGAIDKIAE